MIEEAGGSSDPLERRVSVEGDEIKSEERELPMTMYRAEGGGGGGQGDWRGSPSSVALWVKLLPFVLAAVIAIGLYIVLVVFGL